MKIYYMRIKMVTQAKQPFHSVDFSEIKKLGNEWFDKSNQFVQLPEQWQDGSVDPEFYFYKELQVEVWGLHYRLWKQFHQIVQDSSHEPVTEKLLRSHGDRYVATLLSATLNPCRDVYFSTIKELNQAYRRFEGWRILLAGNEPAREEGSINF